MKTIKKPKPIDYSLFFGNAALDPKYGLPPDVIFCKKCVISNQRPNSSVEHQHTRASKKVTIRLDGEGICDACRFSEVKDSKIDWTLRDKELWELCDRFRRQDGKYDCLVPGSGGKDSVYAAHILKTKYGMHPLTVTWAPHIYTEWGWKNHQEWIQSGFDNYLLTPDGRTHRLLTRLATEVLFHPFQPFIFGQKFMAPKLSALFDIPLVFYGENEAEYGNPIQDTNVATRDWQYFASPDKSQVYIGGVSVADLLKHFGVEEVALNPYIPENPEILKKKKVEVHYLGYYLKWHPQSCYYYAVENCGFQASPERTPGTYSKYNSIDDRMDDLHYYSTYIKFGIGRATYDASQEIRSGDINREEGVALVKKFDGEWPERFITQLLEYLSLPAKRFPLASKMFEEPILDRQYFSLLADQFRSNHIWKHIDGKWQLRKTVY